MNPITTVIVLLVESNILCGGDVASTCYQKKKKLKQKQNLGKDKPWKYGSIRNNHKLAKVT